MGPIWGQKYQPPPVAIQLIVKRVERRCDIVELVIEKICVRVGRDRNRRVPHGFLQQSEVGACPA